jgi:ABC-type uncharacterized transport system permease subunit
MSDKKEAVQDAELTHADDTKWYKTGTFWSGLGTGIAVGIGAGITIKYLYDKLTGNESIVTTAVDAGAEVVTETVTDIGQSLM